MTKIVFTGGHHNSALVLAQYFLSQGHHVEWIGHRHSSRGDINDSAEYLEVTSSNIPFHNLETGRFLANPQELLKICAGLNRARSLLITLQPDKVVSFGGYLGAAVSLAAFTLGIPVYLHEQTVTAGKANKLISRFARRIYLTWKESQQYFPVTKSLVVGLPLRKGIIKAKVVRLFSRNKPTLLVMGGKLGAHVINHFVFTNLIDLLKDYNIVHQTGTSSVTRDYESALELSSSLGSLSDSYRPVGYIPENQLGGYLKSSKYYFGRSGAHICYELALLRLRSILTPLTITHDSEQRKNAQILVNSGLGVILPQNKLSLPHFQKAINQLPQKPATNLAIKLDATHVMYDDILKN